MKYSSRVVITIGIALSIVCILSQAAYAQPPANDECSGAFAVSSLPYSNSQDTRLATPNVTDPILACADSGKGKTVWYTYTADSTQVLLFTTASSTPADYDIAMALYTGSCGALVEMDCNDDINSGTIRQAAIYFEVQAGVTYYIHVAEWKGGGPSGGVPTGGDLVFQVLHAPPFPPIVRGPKFGSVASGASASTDAFELTEALPIPEKLRYVNNKFPIPLLPAPDDVTPPLAPKGSNYKEDKNIVASNMPPAAKPVVLENFEGNTPTGSIPPDPILSVGPGHVMGLVNSSFKIWDKDGNLLKNISLDDWFSNVASPVGFSDPQIHYDPGVNRWFMSGGGFAAPYHFLLSVSDDDNPLGTWYNWALPATLGDSVVSPAFLPDYPQVGFDDSSVYVTTRNFGASFYSQVRIIEKSQLLTNTGGPVTWADYWDFREPTHPNTVLDGIRPSIIYGSPGVHFLVNASPYNPGTFFTVWTINYPLTDSSVTGQNVPVVEYTNLPLAHASQLGGSSILIEVGNSHIRHKPVYRDSSLWAVHPIASGASNEYSALHYVRLNPFTHTNLEDEAMGADGYWHYYPSLMVDGEKNVIVTYTRSGTTEYPGAYVAGHRDSDPPGLSTSIPVKPGLAHYVEDFGGGRNRWGDYMGAALDPSDSTAIWVNTEYASFPSDTWGTWIAKVKMGPLPGKYIFVNEDALTFDEAEVGFPGDTLSFDITNNGTDSLTISSISVPDSHFVIANLPDLPLKLGTFDILTLNVVTLPEARGQVSASITITSDDSLGATRIVDLFGEGYIIDVAEAGVLYASSGTSDGGRLLTVDPATAETTPVGPSEYTQLINIRVNPATDELLGLATTSPTTAAVYNLVRVNSGLGDAHPVASVAVSLLKGMAFRGDTLYVARINGALYRVDIATGAATLVASTGISISGMDFHPTTGQLWASVRAGTNLDYIYKISLPSGVPTLVGATGYGVQTVDIAFDGNGNLFGLIGTGPTTSSLILIDTSTGVAGLVGSMGILTGQGLAIKPGTAFNAALYNLAPRWNMVSVPFVVPDYRKTVIFPTASSNAYEYVIGYQKRDTLGNDAGYWLKFGSQSFRGIIGNPIPTDTMPVHSKWNIIGSRSEEVPVGMVESVPPGNILTNYFEYGDSGYSIASSITPGRGYWVKAAAAGQIVFNTVASFSKVPKPTEIKDYLASYNSILFSDASGLGQMLYIGKERDLPFDREQIMLPPAPPQGVFSARFASEQMLEMVPAGMEEAADYPVIMNSLSSPMRVKWDMNSDPSVSYSLVVTSKGSPAVSTYPMEGAGEIVLRQPSISSVSVRASTHAIPVRYALHQNYPNPFNPQTMIRYELPVTELVTLRVYDILGREVATLVNQRQEAGYYSVPFNAEYLSSGVYFYQLTAGSFTQIQKMMLIR